MALLDMVVLDCWTHDGPCLTSPGRTYSKTCDLKSVVIEVTGQCHCIADSYEDGA